MRKAIVIIVAFLSVATITLADTSNAATKVGLLVELSGQFAKSGLDCKRGYQAARDLYVKDGQLGSRKVEFLVGDTQRDPKVAISELRRFEQQGIHVLVANGSPIAKALKPLTETMKLPALYSSGVADLLDNTKYLFRFWPSSAAEARKMAAEVLKLEIKQIAVISAQDEWLMDARESFFANYKKAGGKIIYDDTLLTSEQDFASVISRIVRVNPPAVLVNLGLGQAGTFIRKLREHGYRGQLFGTYFTAHPNEIQSAGLANIEGMKVIQMQYHFPFFEQLVAKKESEKPTPLTFACFSALAFLLKTLQENPSSVTREQIAAVLTAQEALTLPGIDLPVKERDAQYSLGLYRVEAGVIK